MHSDEDYDELETHNFRNDALDLTMSYVRGLRHFNEKDCLGDILNRIDDLIKLIRKLPLPEKIKDDI